MIRTTKILLRHSRSHLPLLVLTSLHHHRQMSQPSGDARLRNTMKVAVSTRKRDAYPIAAEITGKEAQHNGRCRTDWVLDRLITVAWKVRTEFCISLFYPLHFPFRFIPCGACFVCLLFLSVFSGNLLRLVLWTLLVSLLNLNTVIFLWLPITETVLVVCSLDMQFIS